MAGPQKILRIQTRAHALSTNEPRTKLIYNVWDFQRASSGGNPSKALALTAMKAAILTVLQPVLSVSYVTDFADVRWLDDPFDPFLTSALGLNGSVTGDSLPSLNNVFDKSGTGIRGRNQRGGKHFGPIAESQTLLDELTSAAITLWGTLNAAWLAGFTASDGYVYGPYLVNQKKSTFNPTTATVVGSPITTITLVPVLGRMTRRAQFHRSAS